MHIQADLDAKHADRLLELQQRLNKTLSETIANLIDANTYQLCKNCVLTAQSRK
ncbi:hypothetical protein [Methylomonas sp. 11b]|uniref:hypothetical protein n=1 Tax=Methylomonas sp. 11b TaxID=1168169 RepID=UPI0012DDB953|nr:hypothetical protein [Methylomonas sp. 11b]